MLSIGGQGRHGRCDDCRMLPVQSCWWCAWQIREWVHSIGACTCPTLQL